jgi:hypothetical protein
MNAGNFEQISACWLSEQQPPKYYRAAVARARSLQADATTPRVRQYLDNMIARCEQLASEGEPGSNRRYAGRTRMREIRDRLQPGSCRTRGEEDTALG